MKKKWVVILAVLLSAGAGGAYFYKKKNEQNRVTYRSHTVQLSQLDETIEATGEVAPLNRVEIRPPVAGRIEQLLVDEGARVTRGQILAWMSSSDRAAILDAARSKSPDDMQRWEDTYKPTPVMAPLSGLVILRNAVQGQTVDLSTILFALSDRLIVVSHVDEVDIGKVKIGMPVRITLDSVPDHPIDGDVFSVLFEGKNVSNVITYGVKINPHNPPPFFRSQMTANIRYLISKRENVMLVPTAAVHDGKDGNKQVLLENKSGQPIARPVTLGPQTGGRIEIVDGLRAGDVILVPDQRYRRQQQGPSSPLVMGGQRGGTRR